MKAGFIEWVCNLVLAASLLMMVLGLYQVIYEDLFTGYATGKITGKTVGPEGTVPGLSYSVEYTNPETSKLYSHNGFNPIYIGGKQVGDEITVAYKDGGENFYPATPWFNLINVRNIYAVSILMAVVALAVRLYMAKLLF